MEGPLGGGADVFRQRALLDQLRGRKGALAEPPDGDGDVGAGRRDADRHAGTVAESGIKDRGHGRVQPEGPGNMNSGPVERLGVQRGRGDLPQAPVGFQPHIARAVDHNLAHIRVIERRLKPRQKGFQQVQPVAATHSFPCCFAVQYGRSFGR